MLLSFSVRNFRCFADEVTLSMTSTKLRTNVPRKGQTWTDVTERVAAIFGANASGKTTVLEAIWALSQALLVPGHPDIRQPTAGKSESYPIEYTVDFIANSIRYSYELKVSGWGISHEALYSYPKGSRRMLFARQQEDHDSPRLFEKGASLTGPTSEVLKITSQTAPFLGMASRYGHDTLAPIARALAAKLGVNFITFRDRQDEQLLKRVLMEMLDSPDEQIDLVDALLRAADLGICGVEIRKEEIPDDAIKKIRRLLEVFRDGGDPIDERSIPRLQEVILFKHVGKDGEEFLLPVQGESAGTITWLTTAWHVLSALRDGSILLIDELDASLHPELARYLVELFLAPQFNTRGAQLIFTTHDVSLLGNSPTRLFDPQNVWFTEKNRTGHSELYSLADFDNRRGNNDQRRYLAGQFGAVPDIDSALLLRYMATDQANDE